VDTRFDTADADALAAEGQSLLSFATLLGGERTLRQTLADPALAAGAKRALLDRLLGARVPGGAVDLIAQITEQRWSSDRDMVAVLAEAGQSILLMAAEKQGRLDRVEEEVFRFGRIVEAHPDLQMALTDPSLDQQRKSALTTALLEGKADPLTVSLVQNVTAELHGRPVQAAIADLSALAAQRRGRVVAEVTSALPLTDEQSQRLRAALGRLHHRDVQLNVNIDPSVVGGLQVRVGDDVIDGTLSTRIEAARRRLTH
jgi:F-type H+-transporting ATPase subunit delta